MIGLASALLVIAVGLLVAGLFQGSVPLLWTSFAASVLAALALTAVELHRRRVGAAEPAVAHHEPTAHHEPQAPAPVRHDPPARSAGLGALVPAAPEATGPGHTVPDRAGPASGAHAAAPTPAGEPPVEEVEVTDLLLVLDLTDEVLVVDEHPRYHLAGCPHTAVVATIGLPLVEARTDGFTPCGTCTPDRTLAARERARRA